MMLHQEKEFPNDLGTPLSYNNFTTKIQVTKPEYIWNSIAQHSHFSIRLGLIVCAL